jgi:hypothetical protein
MYGAAKNTWAFPPAKPGNSTKTQSDAAASRHLSLGIASYASADRQRLIIDRGSLLAVGTFEDYIGRMRRIVRGQETYGGGTPSEQATAYNSRLNADARLSQPQLVSRWSQLVDGG